MNTKYGEILNGSIMACLTARSKQRGSHMARLRTESCMGAGWIIGSNDIYRGKEAGFLEILEIHTVQNASRDCTCIHIYSFKLHARQ